MPAKDLSIVRFCKLCKKKFHPYKKRPGLFCSLPCQRKGRQMRPVIYREFKCLCCGIECKRPKHQTSSTFQFCSLQCMANIRGQNMSGNKHPRWKGGSNRTGSTTICKRIKESTTNCAKCGNKEYLQVHHKIPVSERPDLAANPQNIEIICVECHAKEHPKYEGMLLKKKRRFPVLCKGCRNEFFVIKSRMEQKFCGLQCSIKNAKENWMRKYGKR